jgi:hypothetical protein
MSNQIVNCPECGANVDVNKAIYQDLAAKHRVESSEKQQQLKKLEENLKQQQDQLEQQKQENDKIIADQLAAKEKTLKQELANQIKANLENENKAKDQQVQQELLDKSKQIQQLQNTAIENEKLKREKEELAVKYKLEAQKQITEELEAAKTKITQEQQDKHNLAVAEYKKQLAAQKKLAEEIQHQQEQGSIELKAREQKLKQQQQQLEQQKQENDKIIADQLAAKEKTLKQELANQIKANLENENKAKDQQVQQELLDKSKQIQQLQNTAIENEKLKREKEELAAKYKLEAQKQITEELATAKTKIKQEEQDKNNLAIEEYKKQLADQKKLMEEMQRKHEQGSMQLQGEVQELAIEQYLAAEFPLDTIEEIKKGQRGADCLQRVNTREQQNCGTIYYESKRTKNFEPRWIAKFKTDIQDKNANIGVLVTETMPKDMPQAGYHDGIIICSFNEVKGLVSILRQWLIKVNITSISQANKGEKQELIYNYLTSDLFKRQLENIVHSFNTLKDALEKEKKQMKKNWKVREKQLEIVIDSTIDIYGSIRGIAGQVITPIAALELDDTEKLAELEELETSE